MFACLFTNGYLEVHRQVNSPSRLDKFMYDLSAYCFFVNVLLCFVDAVAGWIAFALLAAFFAGVNLFACWAWEKTFGERRPKLEGAKDDEG